MIGHYLRMIFDWSEVWALIIPLAILLIYRPKAEWVKPISTFLILALLLNIIIDFMWYVNKYELFNVKQPYKTWNNNVLYNAQSVARLILFTWFFATQGSKFRRVGKIAVTCFLLAAITYFIVTDKSVLYIRSVLLAAEAAVLLVFCLWYTIEVLRKDESAFSISHPPLWVVGGLTVYTAVNFFIFLFYNYLMKYYRTYSVNVWDVHNALFIMLNICIAIALYHESKRK